LYGCSSSSPSKSAEPSKAAEKSPELLTGRAAFQKVYIAARSWAPDARPFRLSSEAAKDAPGTNGKAGVWRGSFASVSKRAVKPFLWSGLTSPDAPERGISMGTEDTFNPSNTSTQPFDAGYLKIDSDKAFDVAQSHGGRKLLEKTPDLSITYDLDWSPAKNELLWHVAYGSGSEPKLRVAVDATTGEFVRLEK
jgi:hypothetical protein